MTVEQFYFETDAVPVAQVYVVNQRKEVACRHESVQIQETSGLACVACNWCTCVWRDVPVLP